MGIRNDLHIRFILKTSKDALRRQDHDIVCGGASGVSVCAPPVCAFGDNIMIYVAVYVMILMKMRSLTRYWVQEFSASCIRFLFLLSLS